MAILVDTNILIDISIRDPDWYYWSRNSLAKHFDEGLVINPVIFAEFSHRYDRLEDAQRLLDVSGLIRENLPWASAFLAGKAFRIYRERGGSRTGTLPDFFIGAHALVSGYSILTRDPSGYRTYFPQIALITPEGEIA